MKFTEWLSSIVTPLFDKKEDADLFVSASAFKDLEIQDDVAAKFNSKFLTRERALTDEEILKKVNTQLKGQVFGSIDQKFKKFIDKLSPEDKAAIDAEPNTLLKMELLSTAIDNLGKNDDVKKLQESFRKKEADFHEKIKGLEGTIKEKDSTFEKKIKENQLDFTLRNKIFSVELAPEFSSDERRNFLADSTISKLKKAYVLQADEKDASIIHLRKEVDGVIVDVYEGNNNLVTLDDVLKKEYEPFTKKSAASTTDTAKSKQIVVQKTDQPVTLRERILAANPV